jgi:hypothetical protein
MIEVARQHTQRRGGMPAGEVAWMRGGQETHPAFYNQIGLLSICSD